MRRSFSEPIGGAAVISPGDVWVFGQPSFPSTSTGFGTWHYNGRAWTHVASGHGLEGGSGLSAHDVWAFDGTDVAHWNGSAWSRTSVARLLPAAQKTRLNDPAVTGILPVSKNSVYATGNGNQEDDGGPMVLLHWNGRTWSKVAGGPSRTRVDTVARIPGTSEVLAGGLTHAAGNAGVNGTGVLLESEV